MIAAGSGRKMLFSAGLIAAGLILIWLDERELGAGVVTTGLTLGGWAQGLHTPMPSGNEASGEE